ncbi:MAG: trypsin-like serine protease [Phycisphaerae bacterium]
MNKRQVVRVVMGLLVALWAMPGSEASADVSVTDAIPTIVAGDPDYTAAPDLPAYRVDTNDSTSAFAGVGSLEISYNSNTYTCSGTLISPWHVLTAGHAVDVAGDDGVVDVLPGNVTFHLNASGDNSSNITAKKITIHPDFKGFANPAVNDDLAIITLSEAAPAGVPIYDLYTLPVTAATTLTLVGYGRSGDGRNGFSTGASYTVKRTGQNAADWFVINDEDAAPGPYNDFTGDDNPAGTFNEVFFFDFDAPPGYLDNDDQPVDGICGGNSLGNLVETTVGGGDSGGPSFIYDGSEYLIAGVNTFGYKPLALPSYALFGSGGGGMLVPAYADWINSVIPEPATVGLLLLGGLFILRRRTA